MQVWKFETPDGTRYELVASGVVAGRFLGIITAKNNSTTVVLKKHEAIRWMSEKMTISFLNRKTTVHRRAEPKPEPMQFSNHGCKPRRQRINWQRGQHPRGGVYQDSAPERTPHVKDE